MKSIYLSPSINCILHSKSKNFINQANRDLKKETNPEKQAELRLSKSMCYINERNTHVFKCKYNSVTSLLLENSPLSGKELFYISHFVNQPEDVEIKKNFLIQSSNQNFVPSMIVMSDLILKFPHIFSLIFQEDTYNLALRWIKRALRYDPNAYSIYWQFSKIIQQQNYSGYIMYQAYHFKETKSYLTLFNIAINLLNLKQGNDYQPPLELINKILCCCTANGMQQGIEKLIEINLKNDPGNIKWLKLHSYYCKNSSHIDFPSKLSANLTNINSLPNLDFSPFSSNYQNCFIPTASFSPYGNLQITSADFIASTKFSTKKYEDQALLTPGNRNYQLSSPTKNSYNKFNIFSPLRHLSIYSNINSSETNNNDLNNNNINNNNINNNNINNNNINNNNINNNNINNNNNTKNNDEKNDNSKNEVLDNQKMQMKSTPVFFAPTNTRTHMFHMILELCSPDYEKRNLSLASFLMNKYSEKWDKGFFVCDQWRALCHSTNDDDLTRAGFVLCSLNSLSDSMEFFSEAAKKGNETAIIMCGILLYYGLYFTNIDSPVREVEKGLFYFSHCHLNWIALLHMGVTCKEDEWIERAANLMGLEAKSGIIYEKMGDLFYYGVKLPRRYDFAQKWYGLALSKYDQNGVAPSSLIDKMSKIYNMEVEL